MRFFLSNEVEEEDKISEILCFPEKNFAEIVLEIALDSIEVEGQSEAFNKFCMEKCNEELNLMERIEAFGRIFSQKKTDLEKQFNEAGQEMSER